VLHLRILVPSDLTGDVLTLLRQTAGATNVVHLPGAALDPPGDVVLADVAREAANDVLAALEERGCTTRGSIAVETVDTSLSAHADKAEADAPGQGVDAVVWEEVGARTSEEATLSWTFAVFMVTASLIAACGILLDSPILLVGAMVVGPEFGPLAGLCIAAVARRSDAARRSLLALAVGFPLAHLAAWLLTRGVLAADQVPAAFLDGARPLTGFVSHPDVYSVIVAACAGVAGVVSLTSAKSSALIGVVISVTTIPAAANLGVATAVGDYGEAGGAALQLVVNLTTIVAAGTATLAVQRWTTGRRTAVAV
jgi:uncharacterized hydrophobic protein (TIGR00271 family)